MMTAAQVRHHALEIAWASVDLATVDPDLWQSVPGPRITAEEVDAIRMELRVVMNAIRDRLPKLLPDPVQPVWTKVPL